MWEMALIILVGLIFLGPRQLTETARAVGRLFREIQRMAADVKDSIDLDAPPSPPKRTTPPQRAMPTETLPDPATLNKDSQILADGKSGPDFYAELLENSSKDDSKQSGAPADSKIETQFKTAGTSTESTIEEKKPEKT